MKPKLQSSQYPGINLKGNSRELTDINLLRAEELIRFCLDQVDDLIKKILVETKKGSEVEVKNQVKLAKRFLKQCSECFDLFLPTKKYHDYLLSGGLLGELARKYPSSFKK